MTLFERVKEISKKHGFSSLQTLSEQAGLSPNVIYGWKTKEPSAKTLQAVADVLGVSVDYLLGNTDEMHSNKNDNEPVDLDKVLSEEGMAMFDGQPLSDEYKKALLAMLKTMKGND
ncbi:XRE family transcriptional regulator [Weissella confusa]|uniref:XRE family transcriptional regulator n=1 Tax=Weissella confusa TaxID=1583 RepID=UPI0021A59CED|nr:XRE family transcriptional regulator [Weissella confusa]MCT2911064.1 XRE family transcriptional regulator [Weissella confusa]